MKICKVCGEHNPAENKFCINCGNGEFEISPVSEIVCSVCGAKCDAVFTHCISCGAELSKKPQDDGSAQIPTEKQMTTSGTSPVSVSAPTVESQNGGQFTQTIDIMSHRQPQVSSAEETFSCPFCGSVVALHDVFCPECGKDISKYNIHKVVKRKICKFCGKPNLMSAKYCSFCFYDLSDADIDDFQLDYKTQVNETKQAYLQSATSHRQKICSNCGTMNDESRDFCIKCGLQLNIEPPKVYCFVCGQENSPDATFCISCRYPLSVNDAEEISSGWKCECGSYNKKDDMYCSECGRAKNQTNSLPTQPTGENV